MSAQAVWVRYEAPTIEAIVNDLQDHRQSSLPFNAVSLRRRSALFHCPAVIGVSDLDTRADLLVEVVRDAFAHSRLTVEQQIIAKWMFMPNPEAPSRLVHERRLQAVEDIAATVHDRRGRPVLLTARQVEEREAKLVSIVAELLSNPTFAQQRIVASPALTRWSIQPPDDPYCGSGIELVEAAYEAFVDSPTSRRWRDTVTVRAVRHDQRFWEMLHNGIEAGESTFEVLSQDQGHRLFGTERESRPPLRDDTLIVVYFGKALALGETERVVFQQTQRSEQFDNVIGANMRRVRYRRLELRAYIPARSGFTEWKRETWSSGGPDAQMILSESGQISPSTDTVVEHVIASPQPWHHYQLSWS